MLRTSTIVLSITVSAAGLAWAPLLASRQIASYRGGFVVTLGSDTVHVEQFLSVGDSVEGTVVTRVPTTRVVRWSMRLDRTGRPLRYSVNTTDAAGAPLTANWSAGSWEVAGDTIVRQTLRNSVMETQRIVAPRGAFPAASVPYIGVSFVMYELALRAARIRAETSADSAIYTLTMNAGQTSPSRTQAWFVGADSAELDYFGVARSGYKFDAQGRLLRADWTGTTYRYRITRVQDIAPYVVARAWADADRRGSGFGALSPRDTTRAAVGTAQLTIDYGRPLKRGRVVWGDVVPWNRVWRLGADMATHLATTADLVIGDKAVPAGRYTLWMLPSGDSAVLIVNSQTNVFGTGYNAARDFARIPLLRTPAEQPVERLTISEREGRLLIAWDDLVWSVAMRQP